MTPRSSGAAGPAHLTRAGRLVVISSAVLCAAGWYLGLRELILLGGVGLVLTALCATRVALCDPRVEIRRTIEPARVHAGAVSHARLTVVNRSRRTSPICAIRDEVEGTAGAHVLLGRLHPGEDASASYQLPTARRGRFLVGPLSISVSDPFGLARRRAVAVAPMTLVVYPRVERIAAPVPSAGDEAPDGGGRPRRIGPGEELHGLRPYVRGDDLRSVHWPSSARTGDLLVRQNTPQPRGRFTVLVDLRRAVHDDDSLEEVLSAAASILVSLHRTGESFALVTTSGHRTPSQEGDQHLSACLELLAVAGADPYLDLRTAVRALGEARSGGLIAVLRADAEQLAGAAARLGFSTTLLAVVRPTASTSPAARRRDAAARLTRIDVSDGRSFSECWNRALREPAARAAGRGAAW